MANVSINLSQSTMNTQAARASASGSTTLADEIDIFFKANYAYSSSHPYYSSASAGTSTVRLNFSDGAYTSFAGVVLADPSAATGNAVASSVEEYVPSALRLTFGGGLNFHYTAGTYGPLIEATTSTISAAAIQTLIPTYSASYDKTVGNVTMGIQGSINTNSATGDFSGVVTSLTGKADHFISSSSMTASLQISGNGTAIGQNLGSTAVSGVVSSYLEKYTDGSMISVSGAAIPVTGASIIDQRVFADAANFPANDVINISLAPLISEAWLIASGDGNDQITIKGGGSALSVYAGNGNDSITLGDDGHSIDGGAGIDRLVLAGNRAGYTVTQNSTGYGVHANAAGGGTDLVSNVERLVFNDATVALDINGTGGQAYRIYQAAFNRAPDSVGLGFWINAMDRGVSLLDMSYAFVQSQEFTQLYGTAPSNAEIVNHYYLNVLHRAPDSNGFNFWVNILDTKLATPAAVLASFSESPENQAALIGTIGNGFSYTPYA